MAQQTPYEWYNQQMVNKSKPMTAVEWFNQQLVDRQNGKGDSRSWNEILQQAKAMEKEQIKNAYWNGTTDMEKEDALLMAEDYFNEYYKK
jgi:hypothetical protein